MNSQELNITRVPQWHSAGYTGKGIKVMVYEVNNPTMINYPDYNGLVKDPLGTCFGNKPRTHMEDVVDTILFFAPDTEIHLWRDNMTTAIQYCIDNNIDVFNYSATGSSNNPEFNALEQKAIANGTFFVCSAGNDGKGGLTGFSRKDTWLSVGALRLTLDNIITRTYYSSYDSSGKDLDIMCFGDLIMTNSHIQGETKGVMGTSFSAPSASAMIDLFKQWFYKTNNRKPTWTEVYCYIIDNCIDLELKGYDNYTGNGMFIMSEVPTPSCKLELWIGKLTGLKNGNEINLAIAPQLINNRTMVGLRDISQIFKATVDWKQSEKKITITYGNETLILLIGNAIAKKNGVNVSLNIAPCLVSGSTLVGLSDVSKLFEFKVDWDNTEKKITITD